MINETGRPVEVTNAFAQIAREDVYFVSPERPAEFTDEGAVKLAVQDCTTAEAWLESKQWSHQWKQTEVLYESPAVLQTFENSNVTRAFVPRFTVAKAVNTLVPDMVSGTFYSDPPFLIRPGARMKQGTARAKAAVLAAYLRGMAFQAKAELSMEQQTINGTTICKYGVERIKRTELRYVRKNAPLEVQMPFEPKPRSFATAESDEFEIEEVPVLKTRPFFEVKQLGEVLPAPGWREANAIGKAKYVIEKHYVTIDDLDRLRQQEEYDIPARETLLDFFFKEHAIADAPSSVETTQDLAPQVTHAQGREWKETEDPTNQPLLMIERTDKYRVIVVLTYNGRHILVRKSPNRFRRINYLSANWWNVQKAGWGMGIGRLVGSDQRVEQGALNGALDLLAYGLNPQALRHMGANAPTQQIRQRLGGIISVSPPAGTRLEDTFRWVESPKIPPEAFAMIAQARASSDNTSGSDESLNQGTVTSRQGAARSATGAAQIGAANARRIAGPLGKWIGSGGDDDEMYGVFIPFLYALDDMIRQFVPVSEIRAILDDELGQDYELDLDEFLNGTYRFEALAGAHLAAKKAMAQALPLMITILDNPQLVQQLNQTGEKIDVREFYAMFMEVSEWRNQRELVRKMTPQEQQQYQQAQQMAPMIAAQSKIATENAKHKNKSEEIDQENEAGMARDLIMKSGERATADMVRGDFRNNAGLGG